jgi:ribosomal protein L35AE/L33A
MFVENAEHGDVEVLFDKFQDVEAVLAEISYVGMHVMYRNRPLGLLLNGVIVRFYFS